MSNRKVSKMVKKLLELEQEYLDLKKLRERVKKREEFLRKLLKR